MFTTHSQFYKPKETEQKPDEVVDVSGWSIGELTEYPEGTRDKFGLESPKEIKFSFLLPSHKYLLKKTYTVKSTGSVLYEQYWNEIIAYKLGRLLGIKVPPAFVAYYQNKDGQEPCYGSLIEWFYDYEGRDEIKRGGEIIIRFVEGYDQTKGKQHNFETVSKILEKEEIPNWLEELTLILLFDAIIGNTDRHQDNWQIIHYTKTTQTALSPAFDNGTSLAYNIRNEHLAAKIKEFGQYADSGRHHMKWLLQDAEANPKKGAKHFELLQKLVTRYPTMENVIKSKLAIDISSVSDEIVRLTEFDIRDERYKLTTARADFVIQLLQFRFNKLKKIFNV